MTRRKLTDEELARISARILRDLEPPPDELICAPPWAVPAARELARSPRDSEVRPRAAGGRRVRRLRPGSS